MQIIGNTKIHGCACATLSRETTNIRIAASEVNCWTCRTRCYWQLMWCISLSDGERRTCMRHQLHWTTCQTFTSCLASAPWQSTCTSTNSSQTKKICFTSSSLINTSTLSTARSSPQSPLPVDHKGHLHSVQGAQNTRWRLALEVRRRVRHGGNSVGVREASFSIHHKPIFMLRASRGGKQNGRTVAGAFLTHAMR